MAATSHAAAGGTITPLAVLATALVALPLCVALAGRLGSLWRLALAVCASQFLYHWSFWSLGASSAAGSGTPVPRHDHGAQLAAAFSLAPAGPGASGAADAWMWMSHGFAAALTIVLLHRGERAAMALAELIRRALPVEAPHAVALPEPAPLRTRFSSSPLHERLVFLSGISHRGPPAAPAPTA